MALSDEDAAQVRQIVDQAVHAHEVHYHGVVDPPPVDPPPVDPPPTFTDITKAVFSGQRGMAIYSDAQGFLGAGYVGTWGQPGETVTWTLPAWRTGKYAIVLHYQNANDVDAVRLVNGVMTTFPRTNLEGNWGIGSWVRFGVTVDVTAVSDDGTFDLSLTIPEGVAYNWIDLNGYFSCTRVADLDPVEPPPVDPPPVDHPPVDPPPVDPPPVDPPPVDPPPPPVFFLDSSAGFPINVTASQIQTNAPGYMGSGFLGTWGHPNEGMVFPVTVPQDGLYSIDLRYQCAAPDATREVNGVPITLPRTADDNAWDRGSWANLTIKVILHAGNNDVTITVPASSAPWSNWCDLNGLWHITRLGDIPVIPPPPPPPPPSTDLIDITTLGVTPGSSDQQAAIQSAIKQVAVGKTLSFPAGEYRHSGCIELNKNVRLFSSAGAKLIGTDPMNMAIKIMADDASVEGLTIIGMGTTRQSDDRERAGVAILGTARNSVKNCTIERSSAAGIYNEGGSNFAIVGNTVRKTLSDAIHNTSSAHDGMVEGNTVIDSGDDSLAVVSYGGQDCHHIIVRNNTVTNSGARGASVVGGRDVTIEGNKITTTRAGGIYVASEPSYSTEGVSRVVIKNNTLVGVNIDAKVNHGAIFLWGGRAEKPVNDVIIDGNVIKDTIVGGAHIVIQGNNVHRTTLINNATTGTKQHSYIEAASADWTMTGDTHNGAAVANHGTPTAPAPGAVDFAAEFQKRFRPGPGRVYVAITGNDSNPGTSASPKRTIVAAVNALGSTGGVVFVGDGNYGSLNISGKKFSPSGWCLIMSQNYLGAKLDTSGGDGFRITNSAYVGLFGFEITGNQTSSCIWGGAHLHHFSAWRNWVHGGMVGIGFPGNQGWSGPDGAINNLDISYNVVSDCAHQTNDPYGSSGISIYNLWSTKVFPESAPDDEFGYSNYVVGNIVFDNYQDGGQTDGNGIIIDDGNNTQSYGGPTGAVYDGHTLMMSNLILHNGGVGAHIFQTNNVDSWFNTCAHNRFLKGGGGELTSLFSTGSSIKYNVAKAMTDKPWFDEYQSNFVSGWNVYLQGSNTSSNGVSTSGAIDRRADGFRYFKNDNPTLTPNMASAEQWRPDGGSGVVERIVLSEAEYNKVSRWPDMLGRMRPLRTQGWALGALEP